MTASLLGLSSAVRLWWARQSRVASDAWLYGASAVVALLIGVYAGEHAEWHWGLLSVGPFLLGALLVLVGRPLSEVAQRTWRWAVLVAVGVGVVVVPLAYESTGHHFYQPEVLVIDQAAVRLVHDQPIYHAYESHGHLVGLVAGVPVVNNFFPYGPLMVPFGVPAAVAGHDTGLADPRVTITFFTLLVLALALVLLRAPPDRKIRVAQVLAVLPTGSLFLASGGDDMPILALGLLALVAMQRRNAWTTGVVLGVACAMKLTAWPIAVAVAAVSRDRDGRSTAWRVGAVASAIVVGVFAPYVWQGPRAFVASVFEFPLGLAGVRSSAASNLPGHVLADWLPWTSHVLLPVVLVVGAVLLWRYVQPRWPLDPPLALRVLAVAMTVVICAATETRVGYLIYPANFLLWAWVLSPEAAVGSVDRIVLVDAERPGG